VPVRLVSKSPTPAAFIALSIVDPLSPSGRVTGWDQIDPMDCRTVPLPPVRWCSTRQNMVRKSCLATSPDRLRRPVRTQVHLERGSHPCAVGGQRPGKPGLSTPRWPPISPECRHEFANSEWETVCPWSRTSECHPPPRPCGIHVFDPNRGRCSTCEEVNSSGPAPHQPQQ
jgi:hypothetical protein